MKKILLILAISLLMAGCGGTPDTAPPYLLQGAWVLTHVDDPMGGHSDYDLQGQGTLCRVYDGDSIVYACGVAATPTSLVIMPKGKATVTLINKGGGELLYLEDGDPHPLSLNDSSLVIQDNGVLFTFSRADDIYREWGEEILNIIENELIRQEGVGNNRYILSAKEREQEKTIHWFWLTTAAIVALALAITRVAITNRRAKLQLQLRLLQIQEEHNERALSVRQAMVAEEDRFFASDAYAALQKRMASGLLMRDEDWQQVEQHLKDIYPGFINQLRSLYPLSELECHVCMLIKLRIPPKDIAAVLARDISTISTVRSRLYKKVFGRKGSTRDWDDFILSMGA